jgi:hypothetical protein
MNQFNTLFKNQKPIIGMVHLPPLPGAPLYNPSMSWDDIRDFALNDAKALIEGGVNGIQIENQFDKPFLLPDSLGIETVAFVTAIAREIRNKYPLFPLGIHILLNCSLQALAAAKASGANWIRVFNLSNAYISNSGYVSASAPELMRYRNTIYANDIMIFGDFQVKHGSHAITSDRSILEKAHDIETALGDAVIITGSATGTPPDSKSIKSIKGKITKPLLVGSGLSTKNISEIWPLVDGALIGTSFKKNNLLSQPVDISAVRNFVKLANSITE